MFCGPFILAAREMGKESREREREALCPHSVSVTKIRLGHVKNKALRSHGAKSHSAEPFLCLNVTYDGITCFKNIGCLFTPVAIIRLRKYLAF